MLALYFTLIDDEENRSKFEIVYYTYRKRMLSMAYSVLQNKEDSEDCVQETFIRIARNIKAIDDPYSAETLAYVMKAAKNNAINMLKKNNRRSIYFAAQNTGRVSDDAFFEKINIKNDYERVVKAICEMEEIYRDVLFYRFVMDMKTSEIADLLGRKKAAVKKQIYRGKKILLEKLGNEQNEGDDLGKQ